MRRSLCKNIFKQVGVNSVKFSFNVGLSLLASLLANTLCSEVYAGQQSLVCDSIWMAAYTNADGHDGLHLAFSDNKQDWLTLPGNQSVVNSDFGPWGSMKTMLEPLLCYDASTKMWILTWKVYSDGQAYARATSSDLITWSPQHYFEWKDLSHTPTEGSIENIIALPGSRQRLDGTIIKIPESLYDNLRTTCEKRSELNSLYNEITLGDSLRFKSLTPVNVTLDINAKDTVSISDMLIGIFFEDINYAADGGLYAEMVQNRDFEYVKGEGHNNDWGPAFAWRTLSGDRPVISNDNPLHEYNLNHVILGKGSVNGTVLLNGGYDGYSFEPETQYRISLMCRNDDNMSRNITVTLLNEQGQEIGRRELSVNEDNGWHKYEGIITAADCTKRGKLKIEVEPEATLALDMISLFPVNTYKGRINGLRRDLAEALANLKPRFVRFPGGCVAHGNGVDNIYDWKGSIGPLESRKPLSNLWGYHQTRGLGYFEYFQMCEDFGAEPLPVLAAGVPCQNSSWPAHHSHNTVTHYGQQGGIPIEEMEAYIQDVLDLIEYANGDESSYWGALRVASGHAAPFNLKYIGIGNEDMITEVFEQRFNMITEAVRKQYPEIKIVGTAGPFYEGTDYNEGWRLARQENIPLVDEHYYVSPGWMIYNQDYYDNYPREGSKVYLGEYAAHLPDRASTLEAALAEALYLTGVERNGDVVSMTSYAPLLAKEGHTQWRPDMIYFTNDSIHLTPTYYVQQMYGQNPGNIRIGHTLYDDSNDWKASSRIGASVVKDNISGDYIVRIVNVLPVAAKVKSDLSSLDGVKTTGRKLMLSGTPNATFLQPQESEVCLSEHGKLEIEVPAYSFTILRF